VLRSATDADVDAIRRWRNQEPNREASINSHEITAEEHAAWWAKTSTDPTRLVLIYERGDTPSGVVNFFDLSLDGDHRMGAWGFFLDAEGLEERRELLPAWIELMSEAADYAFDELALNDLYAEVLEHNTAVRQMNRRFRFQEGEPERRDVDGRTITVIPISLNRHARHRRKGAAG